MTEYNVTTVNVGTCKHCVVNQECEGDEHNIGVLCKACYKKLGK